MLSSVARGPTYAGDAKFADPNGVVTLNCIVLPPNDNDQITG